MTSHPSSASIEIVASSDLSADFQQARAYLHAAKMSAVQGTAMMILAGSEIARLREKYSVQRGGDRRSDQTRSVRECPSWGDLVKRELGISEDTAMRWSRLFEAAKSRTPLLQSADLLTTPIAQLPRVTQIQIQEAVQAVTNGETAQQLMLDWGIARRPANETEDGKRIHYPAKPKKASAEEVAKANRAAAKTRIVACLSALKAAVDDKQVRRYLLAKDWLDIERLAQDRLKAISTLAGKAAAAAAKEAKA